MTDGLLTHRNAWHPGKTARTAPSFRHDIEGLRGIAVLAVVLYHAGLPGVSGGFVGVDVFFVLSGYLITGLLVSEMERTGQINLRQFYARRARRLLPAAAVMLLATLAAGAVLYSPLEQQRLAYTAFTTTLYASNLGFIRSAGNYFDPSLESNPLLHTWSLAVEEQFYFVWPLLILFAARRLHRRGVAWVIGAVSLASFCLAVSAMRAEPSVAFFGSPARAWEFGLGALASLVPIARFQRVSGATRLLGWTGVGAVVFACVAYSQHTLFPGALALVPVVGTVLVLLSGAADRDSGAARWLRWGPLQWLGKLSYSWYLWHWPVLVLMGAVVAELTLPLAILCAGGSLVFAAASHRWIENPVRFHPRLSSRPGWSVILAAVTTAGVACISFGAHELAQSTASRAPYQRYVKAASDITRTSSCAEWAIVGVVACDEIIRTTRPVVVVFGDSHAAQWLPAVARAGERGGWRTISLTKSACPAAEVVVHNPRQGPAFNEHCAQWREEALDYIAKLRPVTIIVANSRGHIEGERRKDERRRASLGEWQAGTRRTLEAITDLEIPVLFLRDTPRLGVDVPTCLARAQWRRFWSEQTCESAREPAVEEQVYQVEKAAAEGLELVTMADLTDHFCGLRSCGPERDGEIIFRDYDHITGSYAAHLSGQMFLLIRRSQLVIETRTVGGGTPHAIAPRPTDTVRDPHRSGE